MKAHFINTHLLVPRSRSSAKVKVKYKGYISQKMIGNTVGKGEIAYYPTVFWKDLYCRQVKKKVTSIFLFFDIVLNSSKDDFQCFVASGLSSANASNFVESKMLLCKNSTLSHMTNFRPFQT